MIVTPAAIAYGFLSVLGVLAGGGLLLLAMLGRDSATGAAAADGPGGEAESLRSPAETTLVLGLAVGQAALMIRVLSWPALYWTLGSYIPLVPGAMCIYGVTQSVRWLTAFLEVVEPLSLLVAGAVFLVLGAYRAGHRGMTARRLLAHLALGGALTLAAALAGILFLAYPKATSEVSCCSVVFDHPDRFSLLASGLVLGREAGRLLLPVAQSLALALLFSQAWLMLVPGGRGWRWALAAVLAALHVAAALLALFETLSPVLTGMARHHCAYCLGNPRYFPAGLALAGLVMLGVSTAVPVWLVWLRAAVPGASPAPGPARRWLLVSLLCLAGWWALVLVPYWFRPATLAMPRSSAATSASGSGREASSGWDRSG